MVDKQPRVFVSYNRQSADRVLPISDALKKRGIDVFLDRDDFKKGGDWITELERQISEHRDVVLVFVDSNDLGTWQQREVGLALLRCDKDDDFRVIPVLLGPTAEPPLNFLRLLMWIDWRHLEPSEREYEHLIGILLDETEFKGHVRLAQSVRNCVCPYRGLEAFREEDGRFFFGREAFQSQLKEQLGSQKVIAVVGPSGSGKSSVVKAGLFPMLRSQVKPDDTWGILSMVPGDLPINNFVAVFDNPSVEASAPVDTIDARTTVVEKIRRNEVLLEEIVADYFIRKREYDKVLLLVDQWEELYTQCDDSRTRELFIEQLLAAANRQDTFHVILTLRGDFYDQAISNRTLADTIGQSILNLGPMSEDELRDTIERPAHELKLKFEDGLVSEILREVRDQPGSLPLLEFLLKELWKRRDEQRELLLTNEYRKSGGLSDVVANKAESVFQNFTPQQKEAARRLLIQLVHPSRHQDYTRKRRTKDELEALDEHVLTKLTAERLLIASNDNLQGQQVIELCHEALIRSWKQLSSWLDYYETDLLLRRELEDATEEWFSSGKRGRAWKAQKAIDTAKAIRRLGHSLTDEQRTFLGETEASGLLEGIHADETTHRERREFGKRLALVDDPRPGVSVKEQIPDISWCAIDTGTVQLENRERDILVKLSGLFGSDVLMDLMLDTSEKLASPFRTAGNKAPTAGAALVELMMSPLTLSNEILARFFKREPQEPSPDKPYNTLLGDWLTALDKSTRQVDEFELSKYPITRAQFAAFLDDEDGYSNPEWWELAGPSTSTGFGIDIRYLNYPMGNVSWFDAIAFCRWLSNKLDCEVRLPTDAEWQLAASGGMPERKYPWGEEWRETSANTYESGLGSVTAVGLYPAGETLRTGVADLGGTVWEWCSNEYINPILPFVIDSVDDELDAQKGLGLRVFRGGSYNFARGFTRTRFRGAYRPNVRLDFIGFRVARQRREIRDLSSPEGQNVSADISEDADFF